MLSYKMSKSADIIMGNLNEQKLIEYLNSLEENQNDKYKFFKNKFNSMDLFNSQYICELKSRRNCYNQYPTTMVGHNKIVRAVSDPQQKYRFYFLFTDGLYYWDFDANEFSVRLGGRMDRGSAEIKQYAYISIGCLTYATNFIVS